MGVNLPMSTRRFTGRVFALAAGMCFLQSAAAGDVSEFGKTKDGETVKVFTLKNANGMVAKIIDRGATLSHLYVPDKDGNLADVVLGFDDVAGYESEGNQYFGCTTGRVANRIAKGRFTLDGKEYELAINDGPNHLHGGVKRSLDRVVWEGELLNADGGQAARFRYRSPDGEEGYPGALDVVVTYTLTDNNELKLEYLATTDKPTPVNLTNHTYFNLQGAGTETVLDHFLTIRASTYTVTDETQIPTGEIAPVEETPLDFRTEHRVGERIDKVIDTHAMGYDDNYVLDSQDGSLAEAARLRDPQSGRILTVLTTEPGVQLYVGNHLFGQVGKEGKPYPKRSALCLETQRLPDAVNQPSFPSIILKPGEKYAQTTVFAFSAE